MQHTGTQKNKHGSVFAVRNLTHEIAKGKWILKQENSQLLVCNCYVLHLKINNFSVK